ncbi:MAG: efflux RND transporter periplasmic adaptor subunit [Thermoguttaceae bacterium]|jgi:RND family efflux transporter MFP subunit
MLRRIFRFLTGWWIWVPVLVVATIATGVLVQMARRALQLGDSKTAVAKGTPIPVRTEKIVKKEVEQVIGATAVTLPFQKVTVRPEVGNQLGSFGLSQVAPGGLVLKAISVVEGQEVHRGDVLVELDDKQYRVAVKQWEALVAATLKDVEYLEKSLESNKTLRELDVVRAEANLKFRIADLDAHTKLRDALEKLSQSGGASLISFYQACSTFVDAQFQLAVAKEQLWQAKANLTLGLLHDEAALADAQAKREAAKVSLHMLQHDLDACRIRSPVDGLVEKKALLAPGQVIDSSTVLMEVYRVEPVYVCMDYPQERLDELAVGQQAEIVLDSFPKETFGGKVVGTSPQVNPDTRVTAVLIEVRNPGNRIRAGISGFARIRSTGTFLTIPATAVMQQGTKSMALRVEAGKARSHEILTGHLLETGLLELRGGLASGDEVVIFGNDEVQDGDVVNTDWPTWSRHE